MPELFYMRSRCGPAYGALLWCFAPFLFMPLVPWVMFLFLAVVTSDEGSCTLE